MNRVKKLNILALITLVVSFMLRGILYNNWHLNALMP